MVCLSRSSLVQNIWVSGRQQAFNFNKVSSQFISPSHNLICLCVEQQTCLPAKEACRLKLPRLFAPAEFNWTLLFTLILYILRFWHQSNNVCVLLFFISNYILLWASQAYKKEHKWTLKTKPCHVFSYFDLALTLSSTRKHRSAPHKDDTSFSLSSSWFKLSTHSFTVGREIKTRTRGEKWNAWQFSSFCWTSV